jgi:hypothetical protein
MSVTSPARLPGIAFEAVAPPIPEALPRMDVAAFVGFATTGPLHLPVPVEDVQAFRDVFGPDAALAVDAAAAATVHAFLGPAVEAFFRNGGRRCWVVRVADESVAAAASFPVPGLIAVDRAGAPIAAATLRARSPGTWADALELAAVLEVETLPRPWSVHLDADRDTGRIALRVDAGVVVGDLLRLRLDSDRGEVLVRVVAAVADRGRLRVRWDHALHRVPTWPGSPPAAVRAASRVTTNGRVGLAGAALEVDDGGTVLATEAGEVRPGDVVLAVLDDAAEVVVVVGAEAGPGRHRVVAVHRQTALADPPAGPVAEADVRSVERLRLGLRVGLGDRLVARRDGLVLDPSAPGSWAALATDEQTWAATVPAARPRAATTRAPLTGGPGPGPAAFPLAGPAELDGTWWLPLGVPSDHAAAPRRAPHRRGHDGLARFGPDLFLDHDLASLGTSTLLAHADRLTHLAGRPRRLRGIHALLDRTEVSLVAVPDAAQPGWRERAPLPPPAPPDAPLLDPPTRTGPCTVRLTWTTVEDAASWIVQEATDPAFTGAVSRHDGPLTGREGRVQVDLDGPCDCPERRWFRVRARNAAGQVGPWTATVSLRVPDSDFDPCTSTPAAPVLRLDAGPDDDRADLRWHAPAGAVVEIERADEPSFAHPDAATIVGAGTLVTRPRDAVAWYRARAVTPDGVASPWSNTVAVPPATSPRRETVPAAPDGPAEVLLAVQRSLLRLCAARGDVVAVLPTAGQLPDHAARQHVADLAAADPDAVGGAMDPGPAIDGADGTSLTVTVPPLDPGELPALGFGMSVHPWVDAETTRGLRRLPPDGVVTGVIARRTLAGGAWLSPGGQPLRGVLGGAWVSGDDAVASLTAAGLNVVARNPIDPVLLTANTLDPDDTVRPLGVRRLLVLLRRLSLRHGTTYVFEPNGPTFHAMVRRTFESILADLFRRGALVGATAEEAFRVVVDDSVNPPPSLDAGRFVAELQVAPAHPLEFIRIRLVQAGAGTVEVDEVAS